MRNRMRCAWGGSGILVGNFLLDLDRALHGLDDAGELGDHGVAPGIHDPPVMARHQSGNGGAVAAQRAQRSRFVCFHEAGIAVHVGAQDGGQPPFHLVICHRLEDSPTGCRMHAASNPAPTAWNLVLSSSRQGEVRIALTRADSSKGKPMATSLYDLSVPTFLQTVSAVARLPRPRGQALRRDRRRPGRLRARPPLRRHGALPFPDRSGVRTIPCGGWRP